jgi:hypothetical protein
MGEPDPLNPMGMGDPQSLSRVVDEKAISGGEHISFIPFPS